MTFLQRQFQAKAREFIEKKAGVPAKVLEPFMTNQFDGILQGFKKVTKMINSIPKEAFGTVIFIIILVVVMYNWGPTGFPPGFKTNLDKRLAIIGEKIANVGLIKEPQPQAPPQTPEKPAPEKPEPSSDDLKKRLKEAEAAVQNNTSKELKEANDRLKAAKQEVDKNKKIVQELGGEKKRRLVFKNVWQQKGAGKTTKP